jgi:hypothetical protein
MSRSSTATVNPFLTNYAQGLSNDLMGAMELIRALCPTVQVSGAAGQFKSFNDRNSFTAYTTARALGGEAKRILFEASDGSFNCKPQALEVTVDQHERELAGGQENVLGQQRLDQAKVRALLNSTALSHADKIVQFVLDNTTPVADRGNWSNADIDPIDQLDEQLDALTLDVGSAQFINLVLSTSAWRALRNHAKVKARCSGVQIGGITREQLQGLLMIPVNVVIGHLAKTSNKEGQSTVTKTRVVGSNAILTYSLPSPTEYDPSAFKVFTTGSGNIEAVRTYQDGPRVDVHAVDWSEDIKKTSALAVKRLAIT